MDKIKAGKERLTVGSLNHITKVLWLAANFRWEQAFGHINITRQALCWHFRIRNWSFIDIFTFKSFTDIKLKRNCDMISVYFSVHY